VWTAPAYRPLAEQLLRTAGARVAYDDPQYLVFDLGPNPPAAGAATAQ
jgi:hypothetical protein